MPPPGSLQDNYLLARILLTVAGGAGIWLPVLRRSFAAKAALTAALLFAVVTWTPPLLTLGVGAAAAVVAVGLLRRRSAALDRVLTRAVEGGGDAPVDLTPQPSRRSALLWCGAGFLVVCLSLVILETHQPYFFCQDDMLVGDAPELLQAFRGVWKGVWPEYDPYQFMGMPIASNGTGGLTYPPAYLAYAIARHVLHNEAAQIDVSAILHIVAGYFVLFWVARRMRIGPMLAAVGSLSAALSGGTLIMGRSWGMFIDALVWVPLLLYAVVRMTRGGVGWKWFLLTGGTVGLFFQMGFVQLWATTLLFMAIAAGLLCLTGQMPWRRLPWLGAAVLLGIAISVPVLYQQWLLTADMVSGERAEAGVLTGLFAMLLPYPFVRADHPLGWGGLNSQYMGGLYYFGTLFALLAAGALAALLTGRTSRRGWGANVWAILLAFTFLLALGYDAGIWHLMSALPVINIVNHYPFRMLPFVVLFAVLAGGMAAERVLRGTAHRGRWELAMTVPTIGLILCHVWFSRSAFYTYGFRPTPARLPAEVAALLRPGDEHPTTRIMAWGPARSSAPEFGLSMRLNLPALHRIPAFDGYSPVMDSKTTWVGASVLMDNNPVLASQIYGVRYHVVSPLIFHPVFSSETVSNRRLESSVPHDVGLRKLLDKNLNPRPATVVRRDDIAVLDVGPVNPLAFPLGHPEHPLTVTPNPAGVDVDLGGDTYTPGSANQVVVNFLWYPALTADVNGQPVPCSADEWGRTVVALPPAAAGPGGGPPTLHVRYKPDWSTGLMIGGVIATVALLAAVILTRLSAEQSAAGGGEGREEGKRRGTADLQKLRRQGG